MKAQHPIRNEHRCLAACDSPCPTMDTINTRVFDAASHVQLAKCAMAIPIFPLCDMCGSCALFCASWNVYECHIQFFVQAPLLSTLPTSYMVFQNPHVHSFI